MSSVRVGCGSANERDRPHLAEQMVTEGRVEYVGFDNLAERTLAFAQLQKVADPTAGFNPLLRDRMRLVLGPVKDKGIRLVGNMGAANPGAAGEVVLQEAEALGLPDITVAVVTGDDVLDVVKHGGFDLRVWETGGGLDSLPGELVSANAYTGADGLLAGLDRGADVVVAGRCSDLSPYVAALAHKFGWSLDDWDRLGIAGLVGHLLECGRYVTGGAHACPTYGKHVQGLDQLSLPLAEVDEDGSAVIGKVDGTGGVVSVSTVKEQVLHEVHDPTAYLSPDATLDFSQVRVEQVGPDKVRVSGAVARPPTDTYKVLLGVDAGWIAEGGISFAGAGAVAKAEQCIEIVEKRLARLEVELADFRTELVGVNSTHGPMTPPLKEEPYEVRLRIAGRSQHRADAEALAVECEDLWFGPIGGGGVRTSVRRHMSMFSTLLPRRAVPIEVTTTSRRWERKEGA